MRTSPNGAVRANVLKNARQVERHQVAALQCAIIAASYTPYRPLVCSFQGVDEKRRLRLASSAPFLVMFGTDCSGGCRAAGTPAVNPGCSQEEKLGSTALGRRGRERMLKWRSNCGAMVVRRCRIMPAAAIAITAQVRGPT